jgi:hypothetical protein
MFCLLGLFSRSGPRYTVKTWLSSGRIDAGLPGMSQEGTNEASDGLIGGIGKS